MVGVSPTANQGSSIKINAFGGMQPAIGGRLLSDNAAVLSQNTWLYSGEIVGLVSPTYVRDLLSSTAGKVYRIPNNYFDSAHFNDATWMEFPNIDTDVIRSPIVGDTFDRYYWAAASGVPQVNSRARITAGSPPYTLGVPQPTGPTLAITGGASATIVSRAYTVTFVTAFNEEGPPATPVLGTGKIDATYTLTLTPPIAGDILTYNLSKANIYRTVTSTAGVATFFFVGQVAVTATTYADTALDAVVSANNILPSTTWTAPPSDLVGWVTLPNGMIAGWRGSEIWFCEPFRPHAWPAAYAVTAEYPIVGLGVVNQTLVVLTAGYPMVATGLNPAAMSLSKLSAFEPCMSRGSILSTVDGVYYASPNGLVMIANGAATIVTQGLIMKDEWNRFSNVPTMRATRLAGAYFAFGTSRPGFTQINTWEQDFVQPSDFTGAYNGIIVDPTNARVAFNVLTSDTPMTNVFNDPWSGETVLIRDGKVYRLDIANETGPRQPYIWRSKLFQPNDKKNYQALRVYFDIPPWSPYVYKNQIPAMTDYTTAGVTISADNEYPAPGLNAWRAASSGATDTWLTSIAALPHTLTVDFGAGNGFAAAQYSFRAPFTGNTAWAPKSWIFQGSNDGVTWVTLDSQTNVPAFASLETRTYAFTPGAAYQRYRIQASKNQADDGVNFYIGFGGLSIALAAYGYVRIYADGRLVVTRQLRTSGELMRIPSGFKADFWQIEFEANVKIQSVQMATSDKALKLT